MADDESAPAFDIRRRPERRYPPDGGLQYRGATVFRLVPEETRTIADLTALVERVVDATAYTYGDWFDLPMPLYLVHDEERGDVFRVAVRDGTVQLHVLPETRSGALRAFYERIRDASETEWDVERQAG